ncbi:MAG: hypothetical protein EGR79_07625 [Ruminococcaceae bacterium]|nr:hypothetical protein [Oscillospiraceae bacterium]
MDLHCDGRSCAACAGAGFAGPKLCFHCFCAKTAKKAVKRNAFATNLARKYGKTPAQILLRWNVQQGIIPIPKSKTPARLAENIACLILRRRGRIWRR